MANTAEAVKAYQKEYNRRYKLERKLDREEREALRNEVQEAIPIVRIFIAPVYKGMAEQCCSHFGCGRSLSITEQLYGSKCINHSNTKTIQTFKHGGSV